MIKCLCKKVIPKSIPKLLESSNHIFPDYITHSMEPCTKSNKKIKKYPFVKMAKILVDTSHRTNVCQIKQEKKIRQDIGFINNNHVQHLTNKLYYLCTNSK